MNINDYQIEARRTCSNLGSYQKNMIHMQFGVISEWGEVIDIFKKYIAYNKEIDLVNLGEELSDVVWYVVNMTTLIHKENFLKTLEEDYYYLTWKQIFEDCNTTIDLFKILTDITPQHLSIMNILGLCAALSDYFGIDFYKNLENNINKLKIRYPEKFDIEMALNRNLEDERKELEK